MSLRLKIALALAAIGLVSTVSVGIVSYRSTEDRLVSEVDDALVSTATLLGGRNNTRIPERVLADVYSARLLNGEGGVIGTSFAEDVPVDLDTVASVSAVRGTNSFDTVTSASGTRYRVLSVSLDRGVFQIARPLDETDNVLDSLRARTALLVVIVSATSALVGWVLADRVAAPLRKLASAAEEIGTSGRLDTALPDVGSTGDEVGRLRGSFGSMLDALARSKSDQERLVQDAGHELRTPLTSLRTNLSVVRRHPDMPDDMRDRILDDLDGEVSELTELVNELVTAASGGLVDEPAVRLDVVAAVRSTAERIARRRDRQIDVEVSAPPGHSLAAVVPPTSLDRAVSNLLENACKFDPSAGPITVRVTSGGHDAVQVRIEDRGPGIDPADLPHVFERFHRSEATRTLPGSGLGLSIVRDIALANGGSVFADNRAQGGAVVGFDLPQAPTPGIDG